VTWIMFDKIVKVHGWMLIDKYYTLFMFSPRCLGDINNLKGIQ